LNIYIYSHSSLGTKVYEGKLIISSNEHYLVENITALAEDD